MFKTLSHTPKAMDIREWDTFKRWQIEGLEEHIAAGRVDRPIIPFLREVNKRKGIVTTSSCAGRVMLIAAQRRKKDSERVYIEHEVIEKNVFFEALERLKEKPGEPYFKLEPFIYHFVARDLETAERLVEVVFRAGVKRVGMRPIRYRMYLIEFMGTIRISIPLSFVSVDWETFLPYAQAKLDENAERRKKVERAILEAFPTE